MKLSILDFGNVTDTPQLARMADLAGYSRYWIGEHHSSEPTQQCANPLLLGSLLALGTSSGLRIGSGGACLDYHHPYRIAEDARLIESLMPDRFDLGVTRGMALPPELHEAIAGQPPSRPYYEKLTELHRLLTGRLSPEHPLYSEHRQPAPPLWVLGSSFESAEWAARHGTGFCFSLHHGRPGIEAKGIVEAYRGKFTRSQEFRDPIAIIAAGVLWDPANFPAQVLERFPRTLTANSAAECAEKLLRIGDEFETDELMVLDLGGRGTAKRHRELARAIGLPSRNP